MHTLTAPTPSSVQDISFLRHHEETKSIVGWFLPQSAAIWDSLLLFQAQQKIRGHLLEIGVFQGASASMLTMRGQSGEACVLVDPCMMDDKVNDTLRRVGYPEGVEIELLRQDSRDLLAGPLAEHGRRKFRFLHIDGEHTGEAVANDLRVASELVGPEGIVSVDDFFSPLYPQITESVLRYLRDQPYEFVMFLCGFGKAYLARPKYAHHYLKFCRDSLVTEIEKRGIATTLSRTTMSTEMLTYGIINRMQDKRIQGPDWDQGSLAL